MRLVRDPHRWLFVALVAASIVSAPPPTADAIAAPASANAWLAVRQETRCEAMRDEYCVGRYGFTIEHDGAFTVGPAPGGERVRGKIGRAELLRLQALVELLAPSLTSAKPACRPGGVPGVRDQVEITVGTGRTVLVYDLGGRVGMLCFVGAWDSARALHEHMQKLLVRFYTVPFPGP